MEEEGTDALEVAAQETQEGKAQATHEVNRKV